MIKEKIYLIDANRGSENVIESLVRQNFVPTSERSLGVKSFALSEYGKIKELEFNAITDFDVLAAQNKHNLRLKTKDSPYGAKFVFLNDNQILPDTPPLPLPFIIKPNFGFASCHVSLISTVEEYLTKARAIRRFNRFVVNSKLSQNTGILCEELIAGEEIAVDSITVNGKTRVFGIFTREYAATNNYQDFIYRIDSDVMNSGLTAAQAAVAEVLSCFNYRNGPSHLEFRRDNDGNLRIIDAAFRIGGMGQMGALIEATSNTEYFRLAVLSAWKKLKTEDLAQIKHSIYKSGCFFVPEAKSYGKVREITGEAFLSTDTRIKHYSFLKRPGESIAGYPDGADYAAIAIGTTFTRAEMDQLLAELKARFGVVYDV